MISKEMVALGTQRSLIREIAAYGARRNEEIAPDKVLDFSIGNPNVPAPKAVQEAILDIVTQQSPVAYNSYTSSAGRDDTRSAIAANLNQRFDTRYTKDNLYLTCGAAASLTITLQALVASEEDEVIVFAPFFPEYQVFIEARGAKCVVIPAEEDFQIPVDKLAAAINTHTKALLINSPNNPSGVVYDANTLDKLASLLEEKSQKMGSPIYLISDEPYRELVYGGVEVPFVPHFYTHTLVCYSWSKSLSLPGERIGYILVPDAADPNGELMAAVQGAGRVLGFVCAPSLFQQVITRCVDVEPDVRVYETNRNLLADHLERLGYEFARPDGAFYLFIKSPFPGGGQAFFEKAKALEMLLVPADGFGCPDYVRLSYCTDTEQIEKAIPIFEKLIQEAN